MKLNSNNFRTVDEVVADASFSVGDPDMRIRTLGWYRGRVKRALQGLAIETNYYRRYETLPIEANLGIVVVPSNVVIKCLHTLWCCTIDADTYDITSSRLAYPKTANYTSNGSFMTYFAVNDPKLTTDGYISPTIVDDLDTLFYTQDIDAIYLKGAYEGYTHVRIDYSGYGHDIAQVGDAAIVPIEVTEAVEAYVAYMYWKSRMGENPSLAPMYDRAKNDLYGMLDGRMSLWDLARRFLVRSSPDQMRLALHNWRR